MALEHHAITRLVVILAWCPCNQSDLLISVYLNIAVFCSIFQYISVSHSIFNICEYLTSSFPSSNDVNQFNLFPYFTFRCYFNG